MTPLRDRLLVITGASSGIGRAVALQAARQGARLALAARRIERLRELAEEIRGLGLQRPLTIACDVRDMESVASLRQQVEALAGVPEILLVNAGRGAFRPLVDLAPSEAADVIATNLTGAVFCVRAFLPAMLARGSGQIVFVSSVLGELPAPEHAVYGATKFALTGLAESLGYELGPRGIHVTLVEPGLVSSEFAQVSGTPLVRFRQIPHQTPERVAATLLRAVQNRQRYCVADRFAAVAIAFRRHCPRLAHWVFARAIARAYAGHAG
jgi:short-subunit dehydrogenase